MDEAAAWRGIQVEHGRLRYRPPAIWWWRPTLRFEPAGLVIVNRSGAEELLPWSAPSDGWECTGVVETRNHRGGIRINRREAGDPGVPRKARRVVWLPSTSSTPPHEELPALVAYLRATPEARPQLADPARCDRLIAALATRSWDQPLQGEPPLAGNRLDAWYAVHRQVVGDGTRRFGGRPVRGEPVLDPAEAAARAGRALPSHLRPRIDDELLLSEARRQLIVGAWPFDLLSEGKTG